MGPKWLEDIEEERSRRGSQRDLEFANSDRSLVMVRTLPFILVK